MPADATQPANRLLCAGLVDSGGLYDLDCRRERRGLDWAESERHAADQRWRLSA
jgi:hypothetical protein